MSKKYPSLEFCIGSCICGIPEQILEEIVDLPGMANKNQDDESIVEYDINEKSNILKEFELPKRRYF